MSMVYSQVAEKARQKGMGQTVIISSIHLPAVLSVKKIQCLLQAR